MIGRELSYGKYHGLDDQNVRRTLRVLSFVAVFGLLAWSAIFARLRIKLAASAAIRRVRREWILIASIAFLLVVSQIADKDLFYVIRPPEIAQVAEESLETLAYIVLIWLLMRLNVNHGSQ